MLPIFRMPPGTVSLNGQGAAQVAAANVCDRFGDSVGTTNSTALALAISDADAGDCLQSRSPKSFTHPTINRFEEGLTHRSTSTAARDQRL